MYASLYNWTSCLVHRTIKMVLPKTASMKIGIDKNLYSMRDNNDRFEMDEISNALDSIIGVTINDTKSYSDKDKEWFEINLAFESLKFINELENLEDRDAAGFMGKVSITKDENGNLIFKRKIAFKKEN